MSTEIAVLRALLLLTRSRSAVTAADVVARVREDAAEVERTLGSLARQQLVQRRGETVALSLSGLAVAVAAAAHARATAKVATRRPSARVVPLVARGRRRRAA
jgi:DNA-binding IclR family transcriptional regulator